MYVDEDRADFAATHLFKDGLLGVRDGIISDLGDVSWSSPFAYREEILHR